VKTLLNDDLQHVIIMYREVSCKKRNWRAKWDLEGNHLGVFKDTLASH
jgi:hypothetical protein